MTTRAIVCSFRRRVIEVRVKGKLYRWEDCGLAGSGWINRDNSGRVSPVPKAAWQKLERALADDAEAET